MTLRLVPHRPPPDESGLQPPRAQTIARDFADPCLELVRVAGEAAEIEHALMVQYLFAAFSVKPRYAALVGYGNPHGAHDLMSVAVQEMHHLRRVNELLLELDARPVLRLQDFPFESDLYPFAMNLAPLSRATSARYVFTEAPAGLLAGDPEDDDEFLASLRAELGDPRPNRLGSVYGYLIELLAEIARDGAAPTLDHGRWTLLLEDIRDEGERAHFELFRAVYTGTHPGFGGASDVWGDPADEDYPSFPLPANRSAYRGHQDAIADDEARRLAWLSDLQYWIVLALLGGGYRGVPALTARARAHMNALRQLGAHLAVEHGCGLPFDRLSMGDDPGRDAAASRRLLARLVGESMRVTAELGGEGLLPERYADHEDDTTLEALR